MSHSPEQLPSKIEEWSKEHVFQWLKDDLKVYYRYADALYEKGVSGAELLHFEKKHLLELGIKHGPAVKIMGKLDERKRQSDQTIQSHSETQRRQSRKDISPTVDQSTPSQSLTARFSSDIRTVEDHDISSQEHNRTAKNISKKKKEKKKSPPDPTNTGSQDIDDKDEDEKEKMASFQEACETKETEYPGTQTVRRSSSSVFLEQKDEDIMTALRILCENECENIHDESSEEFEKFRIKTEEEFYRGSKVQFWNFYFSEKPKAKAFIKRDKYEKLKSMIRTVRTKDPTSPCVMLNLFHHPGCGGTTLAMHVMWNLRKEFRCAILMDNTTAKSDVALQVKHLMKCGKTDVSYQTPVLLLVDDSEETENTLELQNCIRRTVDEKSSSPLVIILNCVRSQNPKERYRTSIIESIYITNELSKIEQDLFEEKLQEFKENHKKPENFYSFMIMKTNFSNEYTESIVSNTLKNLDVSSKQAAMLSFLALLNTFVANSSISLSVCETFLGIKHMLTSRETVEQRMEPYSTLLTRFKPEVDGTYTAIRILHQRIAIQCLEELGKQYKISKSEIVIDLLNNDLFFNTEMGKNTLMDSIYSMLITRQLKKEGGEKHTLFSPLIEQIQAEEPQQIQHIFEIASLRFQNCAAIPQTLARHLYLIEKDFTKAYVSANDAKNIKENSYTVDTTGQVSKSELKYKFEKANTQENGITPDDLEVYLDLASKATKAFQRAQELAKTDMVPESEDHMKRQRSYNISGYMGEIDTAMIVFEIMCSLPFFKENDQMTNKYMQSFLNGSMPIRHILTDDYDSYNQFSDVLEKHTHFLTFLKSRRFQKDAGRKSCLQLRNSQESLMPPVRAGPEGRRGQEPG
ncbi:sterile alpha motif domain-containing protein 9-like [Anguilla anguilla]|uniref:sterile alpha motif domain-containing protein 9-like n=1 Tax=Anguilla anguilla TaxID=7936 RepID=UPI0015A924C3|nr:sterile alpha motif domain-containing protein 9-like [Anguilla anguilla]